MLPLVSSMCMRTTIDINDELLREAKKKAARDGTTLRDVVEAALRAHLGGRSPNKRYKLQWRTERGRLRPNVRLDDRDALFDLMEGRQ